MNTRSSSNIRRQLFTDEQQLVERDVERRCDVEESEKLLDQKQAEWNFDFRNGKPLPGRYEWIKVGNTPPSEDTHAIDTHGHMDSRHSRHSRASVTQRYIPYDLRSRSRDTRNNELRISSVERYTNRDNSNVITSAKSSERLEGDVRT